MLNRRIQKSLSLNEKYWKNFREKVQENGPAGRKKDKTERVIGLGRRTGEETVKWNQMTALRFQTGGRHQISPASLRGLKRLKEKKKERERQFFSLYERLKHARVVSSTKMGLYASAYRTISRPG